MSRQQPGMSQPRPNQQQGYNDMQSRQQHLIYKQLQEIHRQRQLQQQDLGGRQQNSPSHLSDVAQQVGTGQLPQVLSGMPVNNASNYTRSCKIVGPEPETTNSSLMFHAGNMNSAHRSGSSMHGISSGLMFSHDQGQTMHPMGFVQQLGDQSLYGTPVSSTRYSSKQYPQSEGISHDSSDVMNKAGGNPLEKGSMQSSMSNYFQNYQSIDPEHDCVQEGDSVVNQGFQGKSSFGNAHMQDLNSCAMLGNFQQVNHFLHSAKVQEYQRVQDRDIWSGKLQENKIAHEGPSRGVSNLDPAEEELLFGTGNGGNWDGSFGDSTNTGTGGYHRVSSIQSNDHFGELPSIQSGSWSALMLDALEASSSDTGLHEEWSGLSSHKTEQSTRNHCALLNGNEKQHKSWDENSLQSASSLTSRSFPLFNDADASPSSCIFPNFQQSTKFVYQQNETVPCDVSGESSQQSSKEANNKQLDQGRQRKQFVGYNIQESTSFDNVANSVWAGQMCGPSVSTRHSADMEYNTQNMHMAWDHQQKLSMRDDMSSDQSNGSNINQSPGGDNTSNISDNDAAGQAHRKDIKNAMHMERDRDGNAWEVGGNQVATFFPKPAGRQESVKSDISIPKMRSGDPNKGNFASGTDSRVPKLHQEVKQQLPRQNQMDCREYFRIGSSQNYKKAQNGARYQNLLSMNQQVRDSSMYNPERNEVDERFDHIHLSSNPRYTPDGGCISKHSHSRLHNDSDGGKQENSMLTGKNSGPLISIRQKSSGQSGRQIVGPWRFQYHPMGNLEMDLEPEDPCINIIYPQGSNRLVVQGLKNQEQGHNGCSEFATPVPSNSMDLGKEHLTDLQRIAKAGEEAEHSGTLLRHDSALSSFDGSAINISQNRRISQTSHNMLELLHKVDQSRISNNVTNFRLSDNNEPSDIPNSTPSDGSACPQQDHSSSTHGFGLKSAPPSQWQPVLDNGLSSQASLHNANNFGTRNVDSGGGNKDSKKNVNSDNRANIYGQMNSSSLPYARDRSALQQQQQQWYQQHQRVSSVTGSPLMNQSANVGSQDNKDAHARPCSNPRNVQGSNVGNVSNQPAQGSFSSVSSRTIPSQPNPSRDSCLPADFQFHSPNLGPSQPINSSSHLRSSGQQLPFQEMRSAAQPSAMTGMSQRGGFSPMLQKIWSDLSAQQRLSIIQAQKIIHKPSHSTGPLPNSLDTNSWTPHKADDQCIKESGNVPLELGTCSTNSQKFVNAEEYLLKGQSSQHMPLKKVDGALNTGDPSQGQEPVSIPSLVRLHPQELNRKKHVPDSLLDSQKEHVSVPNADSRKQSYSLLQQAQAMKGSDSDPSKRAGKRLRADSGVDSPQMEWVTGQRSTYGHNTVFRELDAASQHSSFPSDIKMLSFSKENEGERANTSSELISREKSSEDLLSARQNNLQNHGHSLTLKRRNEHRVINSQMASTWFDQYRPSYKNDQVIAAYDGPDHDQRNTKDNVQTQFFANVSDRMDNSNVMEQRDDTTQIPQRTLSTALAANEKSFSRSLASSATDNSVVLMPKKRKTATSDLLPWHKEVTQGSRRLLSISIAKQDWARAANRLIEKVENVLEMVGNGSSLTPAQRRLILTTQLIQQLLPSIPATFLRADATISYESVTYFVSKLALGDASSLISCPESGSLFHSNSGDMISEKLDSSENIRDHFLLKMMEGFVGRTSKLESDLLRLERSASLLDIRVECHETDRCSIINRFAKFLGRAQTDGGRESSSTFEIGTRHIFAQSHVTAHTVTTNLPEGTHYLSL